MASGDANQSMAQLLRDYERRLTELERRRNADGITNPDTGECDFGGGAGGDGGYYGGGGDWPDPEFPDSSYPPYFPDWFDDYVTDNPDWFDDWTTDNPDWISGALNEGANIDIEGDTIHFAVDMSEPGTPRVGQVWLGP